MNIQFHKNPNYFLSKFIIRLYDLIYSGFLTISQLLLAFNINRSLSKKGCPYDNAVAEATFKTFKTEFINDKNFTSLIQLKLELFDYINWYNNIRIHSTLNYLTPVKYQQQMSTKK